MKARYSLAAIFLACAPLLSADQGWMQSIPAPTPITQLSIPSTHNSAALREPFPSTARCQTLTLAEQLKAGVRFVDLRCRHQNAQFHIFHGPIDQKFSFADSLVIMESFLKTNPSECIIVSIQEAARATNKHPLLPSHP